MTSNTPAGPYGSLNHLPIQVWPEGLPEPVELPTTGSKLLSLNALNKLIMQHAKPLRFPDHIFPSRESPLKLNDSFISEDMGARMAATAIARHYGRYLAAVLLTLRQPHPQNQNISEFWTDTEWESWSTVQKVWFGGGLVAGQLGEMAIAYAQKLINQAGVIDLSIHRAPFAEFLPRIGVARYAPSEAKHILVFDFGQSFIKCGVAIYYDGFLTALNVLPEIPSRHIKGYRSHTTNNQLEDLLNYMVEVMAKNWDLIQGRGLQPHPTLLVAIATRMHDGKLIENESYGSLQQLADDIPALLSERASDAFGQPVTISLVNDAVAAASTFSGESNTAVITLGTNIGSAFVPPATGFRGIDLSQFKVEDAPKWFI